MQVGPPANPASAGPRGLGAGPPTDLMIEPEHPTDPDLVAFLRLFADTMPGMVAYWDSAEICRFANRAHVDWFGRDPDGVLGQSMRTLYGLRRYARERRHVAGVLRGAPQSFETGLVSPAGESGKFITQYVPHVRDGVVAGFASTVTEITPLRSAQIRLEAAYAHLVAERDRADAAGVLFEQLFENAPDAILLVDASGAIVRANKATLTTFRLRPADLTTKRIDHFLPSWRGEAHAEQLTGLPPLGRRGPMGHRGTVTAVCGDGTLLDVEVNLARLRIEERWLMIVTVRDLSELSQAYTKLEQSNMALEQTTMAQRQFIYVASHDLREPVNTISNFTGLLLEDHADGLDDDGRRYLGYVHESADRMRTLLDDLLSFIRLEQAEIRTEPIALTSLLDEIVDDLLATLRDRRARLVVGPLPVVDGQPSLLRVLLQNLVDNATKFQPDGHDPVVEISVVAPEPADVGEPVDESRRTMCELVVADNGIGIEEAHLERVFEIFRRSHSYRRFPGTGIGLALCRRIAQLHGGRIWAEAGVTAGTRIHVTLPYPAAAIDHEHHRPDGAAS